MALWFCGECGTAYSVGAPCCPRCLSTEFYEEGTVPHNVVGGPPSNAAAGPGEVGYMPELDEDAATEDAEAAAPDVADVADIPAVPDPPPVSAPKADWADHAVAAGVPQEDVDHMTKPELVEAVKALPDEPAASEQA